MCAIYSETTVIQRPPGQGSIEIQRLVERLIAMVRGLVYGKHHFP